MNDTDRYIETFRQEASDLLVEIEECVLLIEKDPADTDTLNRLFRAMHTIKGSGSMFGFTRIAAFAHHLESTLDKVRAGKVPVSRSLIDMVLAARDQIALMLDGKPGDVDVALQTRIIETLQALDPIGGSPAAPAPEVALYPPRRMNYRIRFQPESRIFATGTDPAPLLDELREMGECRITALTQEMPALDEMDPESCYLSWEILLTTDACTNSIRDVFIFVEDVSRIDIEVLGSEETLADSSPAAESIPNLLQPAQSPEEDSRRKQAEAGSSTERHDGTKGESVRVPAEKLDKLINLVGELVINQAQVAQVAARLKEPELDRPVEEVDRLTSELRDNVLNIRMMPIGVTFGRFRRLVRDLSKDMGKNVDLVTEGAETELDKAVIDRLADPLVHLIRNCVGHGIESPEERGRRGKPETGTIRLAAAHRGASVVISVEDDGGGLDLEAIRARAIERGIISPDHDLPDSAIYALIFLPAFSTATEVTSVSGRGVGMDVVKREAESLRGTVTASSVPGQGTRIELSLPLTLAIIDGLLVEVCGEHFVIPLSTIEECLELTKSLLVMGSNRNILQVRDEPVPFIRLREFFDLGEGRGSIEEAVVVNIDHSRVGIVVDRVIGDHQTVIKSLGAVYRKVEGISGATIMGDGHVALILDVAGIISRAKVEESAAISNAGKSAGS